ncbi:MAG: DUF1743 domain-containing protein [Halolamina sp.]
MTVLGIDDTDSRERGMCTTYLAARVTERLRERGRVERLLLVRLNPAVEAKTRGNAALAVHTDVPPEEALAVAADELAPLAEVEDPRTSPGVVAADGDPTAVDDDVAAFARRAVRDFQELDDAVALAESEGFAHRGWGTDPTGRGRIGALAAVGAWAAFEGWTYEHISYRAFDRCGTPRDVDDASVFDAAADAYPAAWDTVDREAGEAVCVPNAPGPILYGIRGDDPEAVRRVAAGIDSETVERTALFHTNQGTDGHLRTAASLAELRDGRAYRVDGVVAGEPETRAGGHVFVPLRDEGAGSTTENAAIDCVAFEPTKRFRDRVRKLRSGDRVTVCGEVGRGTLKLEKFALREPVTTERRVPDCPDCGRRMSSAGRDQGYRCRDCGTSAPGKTTVAVERGLDVGWYEVPPVARRHVAKPLVRGGFDAPTHPER